MADNNIKPEVPAVVAQEAKVVGDDNLQARKPSVEVNKDQVTAQVAQPREGDADKVNVHEVAVATDTVITDPSDPLAVQVPDAGRGSLVLPVHSLDGPTVEKVFASDASKVEERDGDAPKASDPNPDA